MDAPLAKRSSMLPTRSGEAAQSRQAMILYSAGVLPMSILSNLEMMLLLIGKPATKMI